jgi:ribonuclease HII
MEQQKLEKLMKNAHYGCDEAGRGCLNGPVVVASVYLGGACIPALDDSKKITDKQRRLLYAEIYEKAEDVTVVEVAAARIDEINILHASLYGMAESWVHSQQLVGLMLVDGNKEPPLREGMITHAIVKGDGRVPAISAASIIAKVHRDDLMMELAKRYPAMEYEKHKGYPTARHVELLNKHGVNETYRMTFGPVQKALDHGMVQGTLF